MLVEHVSLGVGKVVALEPNAVHVFFEKGGTRFATKLRLPMAAPLLSPASAKNPWLKGMSSFLRDPSGRYALSQSFLPQEEAVARFLEVFPKGFRDPRYLGAGKGKGDRPQRWRAAHQAFVDQLGGGEGERLLAAGKLTALAERALEVEHLVASLQLMVVMGTLAAALSDLFVARCFFAALFELLAAPELAAEQFDELAAAAASLPGGSAPAAAWQLVTTLPFIAQPERHLAVRPKPTCDAARRLGHEVSCDAAPTFAAYTGLLRFSEMLLESLRPIGARDNVDLETFLHATVARRASA